MIGYNPIYEYAALPDVRANRGRHSQIDFDEAAASCSGSRVAAEADERGRQPPPQRPRAAAAAGDRGYKYTEHYGADHGRRNSLSQGCGIAKETGRSN